MHFPIIPSQSKHCKIEALMLTKRASQSPQQVYAIALGALLNWCAKAAPLLCKAFPRIARVFAGPVTRSVGEKQKHNACNSCLVFLVECSCLHTSLLCIAGEGQKDPETRIQWQGIFDVLRVFGKRGTAKKGPWLGCKSGNVLCVSGMTSVTCNARSTPHAPPVQC